MADVVKRYTSTAELQDYWINHIAPNYFDFDSINNYRAGLFGYTNEVISTVVMDTHQAINIARREFYPVSAQYPQSFYKMAALQKLDLPLATAASCKLTLLLDRDEIIENSTYKNGNYTCVIDNTVQIYADNIPFSLLYPIVIISNDSNGEWTHTIHYDTSNKNSLDTTESSSNYYIMNKTINQDGKKWLLLSVNARQVLIDTIPQLVTDDTSVQTAVLQFPFEGTLAGFDAFYIAEPDVSAPVQLTPLAQGQAMIETPFCYYRLLNNNTIELSFPKNIYFTPELNSEIRVVAYTSLGKDGNFDLFKGTLSCSMESEKYPYNNNMTMLGIVNGSSKGGKNAPSLEEYKGIIQNSYSTNNTITTANDLMNEFNLLTSGSPNKIVFRKKRADAFNRVYGAYCLLKDSANNVVPTNTLTINMKLSDFDVYSDESQRAFIKPGTLFEYDPASDDEDLYTAMKVTDLVLKDDLSEYDNNSSRFLYTNPFLIAVNLNPNLVGYYNNSINDIRSVEYSYINDNTLIQFIGSRLSIQRNSINGENFYKFSILISPTTELSIENIISIPNEIDTEDYYIKAEKNGVVESIEYVDDQVVCNIRYDDGTTMVIPVSSYVKKVVSDSNESDYEYITGYQLLVNTYDRFIEGDTLATKKVEDFGKIRACLDIKDLLQNHDLYIPMVIEEYNEEVEAFTLCAYISTDDIIDDGTLLIDHGIFDTTGYEDENISIPYSNLKFEVSVFYNNDTTNFTHKYSSFDYFRKHTLTNTYAEDSESGVNLINHIEYIRSTLVFSEDSTETNPDEYVLTIKEIPFTKANWIKSSSNFTYLINTMVDNYAKLQDISYQLDNNYGIDLKFYNTYGKSKFFKAGYKNEWKPLSQVNCSFRFGVYLTSVTNQTSFLSQFKEYVKNAVESINFSGGTQSIYIMSLINDIQKNFSEIGYIEYYGFDEHNTDIQKIEPVSTSEMSDYLLTNYIPEFINICTYVQNGENIPNIQVEFLNITED